MIQSVKNKISEIIHQNTIKDSHFFFNYFLFISVTPFFLHGILSRVAVFFLIVSLVKLCLIRDKQIVNSIKRYLKCLNYKNIEIIILSALFIYSFFHILIFTEDKLKYTYRLIFFLSFIISTIIFFQKDPKTHTKFFIKYLFILGAITLIISYTYYIYNFGIYTLINSMRMKLFNGELYKLNESSVIFVLASSIILIKLSNNNSQLNIKAIIPYIFLFCLFTSFLIFSKTKAAILCLYFITLFILFIYKRWIPFIILTIILVIISLLIINLINPFHHELHQYLLSFDFIKHFVERGDSYRLELIRLSLNEIPKNLIFGSGMEKRLPHNTTDTTSPHNVILCILLQQGVVGLVLYLAFFVIVIFKSLKNINYEYVMIMLCFVLIHFMTAIFEPFSIINSVSVITWFIHWFGVCALIGYNMSNKQS